MICTSCGGNFDMTRQGECLKCYSYTKALPKKEIKGEGKTDYTLLDPEFLKEMSDGLAVGIKDGRNKDDWKKLKWNAETERNYKAALLRHFFEDFDAAAVANNAMIIAYHNRSNNNEM
jgi:hypothetical protein